ncbi:hypothetical protein BU23DRAFT_551042 [Bimuria novae-zelandiae CBS 107.79]|uniref:Uncharacterized protein n=1 Tax=Bimuria novae-zelandiae CBS 107.79 TaxID=1447943 RepID=A0A6A5VK86_9PLEO|nr:hypothetical protein BU23DRAFT_551042 [Bimuria novae-zelandiae CBS 107.79]
MSGNPFRASLIVPNHPTAAPPTSFPADGSDQRDAGVEGRDYDSVFDASPTPPTKTKKSVRIESPIETIPPHPAFQNVSHEPYPASNRGRQPSSPPPEASPALADDFEERYPRDPTRTEVEEVGVPGNTWKSTGVSASAHSPSGAPANPFSRTLATLEPREQGGETTAQSRERTPTEKSTAGPKRQSLNVEGFKNLLMQGITNPRSSGPAPQIAPSSQPLSPTPATFESSSSTDTSSVSRQSIFDAVQEAHPESPRTSYDMAASDDEHASLMGGEAPKKQKKKPPPAPRHRHGKLVRERAPQTVSFEDFSAAETTPQLKSSSTNTDLNKPLPPTPPTAITSPVHTITHHSSHATTSISDVRDSETTSIAEVTPTSTQKKVPPPVPLARRQSQLRTSTTGNRSRSNSSLTISSQLSNELPPINHGQEPTSTQKPPPPPPPSRRHGNALSTINTSSANSSSTELSNSNRPVVSSLIPASSSRRTTLESLSSSPVSGVTRTSSMRSARNTSRAVSNESTQANMPPPPPPPRRRQSGRSSLDLQRPSLPPGSSSPIGSRQTSTEWKRNSKSSFDGKRQGSIASVSSLGREYTPTDKDEPALYSPRDEVTKPVGLGGGEENAGGNTLETGVERSGGSNASNILDDMEKFQREIDELRSKYEKAA